MVALTGSGEIFSLQAKGHAAADGWVSIDGGGELRGNVVAELVLCHGISAAVGAEIAVMAEARLGALWVFTSSASGDASAQAQASARGIFSGNIFEDFGAALNAGADASGSASGQLAAGLDVAGLGALAELLFDEIEDSLPLDLLYTFLNELKIEGGIKGSAYAGATAVAEAAIAGNLLADPSSFEIAIGASAAGGVGAGGKGFIHCELENPRRCAVNSAELVAAQVAAAAREQLPASAHPLVEYVELLMPVVSGAAWDLGQVTALEALAPPDVFADRLVRVVASQLQRWVLDRVVDVGLSAAAEFIRQVPVYAALAGLSEAQRTALADRLGGIAADLPDQPISLSRLGETADSILSALTDSFGEQMRQALGRPLALAWTAAAAVIAVRDPVAAGNVTGSAISTEPEDFFRDELLAVPALPTFVRSEWAAVLGGTVGPDANFADCVNFMIAASIGDQLAAEPNLRPLLTDVAERFDVTIGELVEAVLTIGLGGSLGTTEIYRRVRGLIADGIDDVIVGDLLPQLLTVMPPNNPSRRWIRDALEPSVLAMRHFVLGRVDALVIGDVSGSTSLFVNQLRTLLGVLAGKLLLRNLQVLTTVLTDYVLGLMPVELRRLATQIRADGAASMLGPWVDVVSTLIPLPELIDRDTLEDASRSLLAGLLDTGAEAIEVYTPERRQAISSLQQRALRVDDLGVDYSSSDSVDEFVDNILDCSFVPDPAAVPELVDLMLTILSEQLNIVVTRSGPLLTTFCQAVATPWLKGIQDEFRQTLSDWEESIHDLGRKIEDLDNGIQQALSDAENALQDFHDNLTDAEAELRSQETRDRVREDVHEAGRQTAFAILGEAGVFLFEGLWAVSGFIVDPALEVLADATHWLGDAVEGAADAVAAFAAIETELSQRVKAALLGVDFGDIAQFLGVSDVVDAALGAVRQPNVRSYVRAAVNARARRSAALDRRDEAERDAAVARAKRTTFSRRLDATNTRSITPRILEPAALMAARTAPVHGGLPIARVALGHGDQRLFAGSGVPSRLTLLLNGTPVTLDPGHLAEVPDGIEIRRTLSAPDGLHSGVNILECAVAQPKPRPHDLAGRKGTERDTVAFLWHPKGGTLPRPTLRPPRLPGRIS
jgi:hypothetical protein